MAHWKDESEVVTTSSSPSSWKDESEVVSAKSSWMDESEVVDAGADAPPPSVMTADQYEETESRLAGAPSLDALNQRARETEDRELEGITSMLEGLERAKGKQKKIIKGEQAKKGVDTATKWLRPGPERQVIDDQSIEQLGSIARGLNPLKPVTAVREGVRHVAKKLGPAVASEGFQKFARAAGGMRQPSKKLDPVKFIKNPMAAQEEAGERVANVAELATVDAPMMAIPALGIASKAAKIPTTTRLGGALKTGLGIAGEGAAAGAMDSASRNENPLKGAAYGAVGGVALGGAVVSGVHIAKWLRTMGRDAVLDEQIISSIVQHVEKEAPNVPPGRPPDDLAPLMITGTVVDGKPVAIFTYEDFPSVRVPLTNKKAEQIRAQWKDKTEIQAGKLLLGSGLGDPVDQIGARLKFDPDSFVTKHIDDGPHYLGEDPGERALRVGADNRIKIQPLGHRRLPEEMEPSLPDTHMPALADTHIPPKAATVNQRVPQDRDLVPTANLRSPESNTVNWRSSGLRGAGDVTEKVPVKQVTPDEVISRGQFDRMDPEVPRPPENLEELVGRYTSPWKHDYLKSANLRPDVRHTDADFARYLTPESSPIEFDETIEHGLRSGGSRVGQHENILNAELAHGQPFLKRADGGVTQKADLGDFVKIALDLKYAGGGGPAFPPGGRGGGKKPTPPPPGGRPALPSGQRNVPVARGPITPEKPPMRPVEEHAALWPEDLEPIEEVMARFKNVAAMGPWYKKVGAFFRGRHMRGPTDEAVLKQGIQATSLLQRESERIIQTARAKFGHKLLSEFDRDLDFALKGRRSTGLTNEATGKEVFQSFDLDKLFAKYPQLSDDAKSFARNMFDRKEELDKMLRELGVVPDDLETARANGLLDLYLKRSYLAFALPGGKWGRKLSHESMRDTLRRGVEFVYKEAKRQGLNITQDEVLAQILEITRARDPMLAFQKSALGSPFKSLLSRKNVPAPIREMMGEIHSGMTNIAMTLGTQEALLSKVKLMKEIAANPKFASPAINEALGHTYQLPNHPSMGELRNAYVSQDMFEAIGNLPKADVAAHQLITNVLGFVKGNQVALGGVGPIINSTFGNLWSGVLAGGLDLTRPRKMYGGMRQAWQAMRDYSRDPTGRTGMGWLVKEAKTTGADFYGFGHEEIGNPNARKFINELDKIFAEENGSMFDAWGKINNLMSKYRDIQSKGGWVLDTVDRFFRMQSYATLRNKFIADFARNGATSKLVKEGLLSYGDEAVEILGKRGNVEGFTSATPPNPGKMQSRHADEIRAMYKGMMAPTQWEPRHQSIIEAAGRLAARRVNQSFWNPTFIGAGLDRLRRSAVGGVITPYATAAFETMRINGAIAARLINEPDILMRIGAATIPIGMAFGANGLAKHLNGISQEGVEAAYGEMAKSRKVHRPITFALGWRDSKGRVQIVDLTRLWDPFRYTAGHPDDPMWRRATANLLLSSVEGTGTGSFVREGMERSGFVTPEHPHTPISSMSTKSGGIAVLKQLQNAGAFPGVLKHMQAAVRLGGAAGTIQDFEEPLTPGQAVPRFLGYSGVQPVTTGPGPTRTGRQMDERRENKEIKKERMGISFSNEDRESKRERVKDWREKKNERLDSRREQRDLRNRNR